MAISNENLRHFLIGGGNDCLDIFKTVRAGTEHGRALRSVDELSIRAVMSHHTRVAGDNATNADRDPDRRRQRLLLRRHPNLCSWSTRSASHIVTNRGFVISVSRRPLNHFADYLGRHGRISGRSQHFRHRPLLGTHFTYGNLRRFRPNISICNSSIATARFSLQETAIAYLQDPTHLSDQSLFFEAIQRFSYASPTQSQDCRKMIMRYWENIALKCITR
jgi:hypothetical protein